MSTPSAPLRELGRAKDKNAGLPAGGPVSGGWGEDAPAQRRRREEKTSPKAPPCAKTRPLRARRRRPRAHFGAVGRQDAGGLGLLLYAARCKGEPGFHRLMGVPRCSGASRVKSLRFRQAALDAPSAPWCLRFVGDGKQRLRRGLH